MQGAAEGGRMVCHTHAWPACAGMGTCLEVLRPSMSDGMTLPLQNLAGGRVPVNEAAPRRECQVKYTTPGHASHNLHLKLR